VLSDVVWVIRNFKPDVIINRFSHRTPGTTHGHHTSSAMLSIAAFDQANDTSQFVSQLKYTSLGSQKDYFLIHLLGFIRVNKILKKQRKAN